MGKSYDERKIQINGILRQKSKNGRDIAPIPQIVDPDRRESCRLNFRLFCEIYFANVFCLQWSDDHLKVIGIIEDAVVRGGLFAVAMPRGSGKSSLAGAAAVWAILYGHRSWVVLVAASEDPHAIRLLKNLITDFETNALLTDDFPEVCYPIQRLERIAQRAAGQLLNGESTRIGWTAKELILPTVPGSSCSGSRISVAGITGAIRGMQAKLADGSIIRPDFALIDDPQTGESAQSAKQVRDRLGVINGDILGLAGPGMKISAVLPCTIIQKGDLAEQMLDRKKNPEWQGVKTKLLRTEPNNLKLWEQYNEIRAEALRSEDKSHPENVFYIEHRDAMDGGAEASWSARFNDDEISAIQNAMNLKFRDAISFAAEYQNEPVSLDADSPLLLTTDQIAAKAVAIRRGIVPTYATKLTAFIDVQGSVLFYVVVAFGSNFTAHVVDYGCYPEQKRNYFFLREVSPTLSQVRPGISSEGQIRHGLDQLTKLVLAKDWEREDGKTQQIDRLLIDSGYEADVVKQFIRESQFKSRLLASKGYGIKADRQPMDSWTMKAGGRRGWNWLFRREEEHVLIDTNAWKTFVAQRLAMAKGEDGNLSIFDATATAHKMFCDQVTSEYCVPTEGFGRVVHVWLSKANRENHWWDCLCGCFVAASEQAVTALGHAPAATPRKRRKIEFAY